MCHNFNPYLIFRGRRSRRAKNLFLFALGGRLLGRALLCSCFCRLLLGSAFARGSFGLRSCFLAAFVTLSRSSLLGLGFYFRSFEGLAVKSDLSNPYGGKRLAMPVNLFVLLLPLEMEDQDLVRASAFHHLAGDHGALSRANGACLGGNRQHVIKFHRIALRGRKLLNLYYVSGRHTILLPPGANHRVHNSLPLSRQLSQSQG